MAYRWSVLGRMQDARVKFGEISMEGRGGGINTTAPTPQGIYMLEDCTVENTKDSICYLFSKNVIDLTSSRITNVGT